MSSAARLEVLEQPARQVVERFAARQVEWLDESLLVGDVRLKGAIDD
jgi:hypothetical protein